MSQEQKISRVLVPAVRWNIPEQAFWTCTTTVVPGMCWCWAVTGDGAAGFLVSALLGQSCFSRTL